VVEARPGLRDYRKRLRDRTPTDPFEQQYTGLPKGAQVQSTGAGSGGAASGPGGESSSSGSATPEETGEVGGTEPGPSSGGGSSGGASNGGGSGAGGGSGGGGGATPHPLLFDYAIDVRITHSDGSGAGAGDQPQQQPESSFKHRVLPQTPLPGEKAPVVTYMGLGRKEGDKATGRVLLLVSGDVSSVSGQSRCVSRSGDVCQLLEVEPGFPLNLVYGANKTSYTIEVLDVKLVVTGHT
jgi:hypothetical protein